MTQNPRLVLVEWEDSHQSSGWEILDDEIRDEAAVCKSVGWLLHDGDRAKVVVPHLIGTAGIPPQGCGMMTIPARSILRIAELEEADMPRPDVAVYGKAVRNSSEERAWLHELYGWVERPMMKGGPE